MFHDMLDRVDLDDRLGLRPLASFDSINPGIDKIYIFSLYNAISVELIFL